MSALANKDTAKAKDDELMRISSSGGLFSLPAREVPAKRGAVYTNRESMKFSRDAIVPISAPGDLPFCFHEKKSVSF